MTLLNLSSAVAPPPMGFSLCWAVVAKVTAGADTDRVAFDLYGAPSLDAGSETNLLLSGVPTLTAGDRILVGKTGSGAWVILGKIERLAGTG